MPTYNFQDKETGEILEKVMKISEKDTFLKDNPHLKSVILDVNIVAGQGLSGNIKNDAGWKENMARIAEAHPNSPLAKRYGERKSIKTIKTEQAVKKHLTRIRGK